LERGVLLNLKRLTLEFLSNETGVLITNSMFAVLK